MSVARRLHHQPFKMLALQGYLAHSLSLRSIFCRAMFRTPQHRTGTEGRNGSLQVDRTGKPQPALTARVDFRSFWRDTAAELDKTPIDLDSQRLQRVPYQGLCAHRLAFRSLGNARLRGYSIGWSDDRPRPLVIHAHGYGGRSAMQWLWARSGLNVVGFDVRGHGLSFSAVPDRSRWGYMLTGIKDPRQHVLRGAVADYMRACQVGAVLFEGRTRRTVLHGQSFSGGLALMAEATRPTADFLALGVPTFGWHEGRHRLVRNGSATETRGYIHARPSQRDLVMRTLSYFDSMNFAPLIRCPVIAGFGRQDEVVPPETVLAVLRHLRCPHETMSLPVSHTDEPEEAAWEHFDATWIDAALYGLPPDFGSDPGIQHIDFDRHR